LSTIPKLIKSFASFALSIFSKENLYFIIQLFRQQNTLAKKSAIADFLARV